MTVGELCTLLDGVSSDLEIKIMCRDQEELVAISDIGFSGIEKCQVIYEAE